jgi:hypothetical protein
VLGTLAALALRARINHSMANDKAGA